jgi:hypothetical protein
MRMPAPMEMDVEPTSIVVPAWAGATTNAAASAHAAASELTTDGLDEKLMTLLFAAFIVGSHYGLGMDCFMAFRLFAMGWSIKSPTTVNNSPYALRGCVK